jgi:hypothetical protein
MVRKGGMLSFVTSGGSYGRKTFCAFVLKEVDHGI